MIFLYVFFTGRFLTGVNAGIGTSIVGPYLGEIAPISIRGTIGTFNQFSIVVGVFISPVLGYKHILGSAGSWKYLISICAIPCIIQLLTFWTIVESPKFYKTKKKKKSLKKYLNFRFLFFLASEIQIFLVFLSCNLLVILELVLI